MGSEEMETVGFYNFPWLNGRDTKLQLRDDAGSKNRDSICL